MLQGGEEHVGEFVFVLGAHVDDVGNAAQVADIEEAVMRRPVVSAQPTAIHAEDYGQVLQADVVHNGIKAALQEGGIDGAERPETFRRHSGGEQNRVFFGNAHIVILVRMHGAEAVERGAVRHGRGDRDDPIVAGCKLDERVGKDLRVGALGQRLGLAGLRIRVLARGISSASLPRAQSPVPSG